MKSIFILLVAIFSCDCYAWTITCPSYDEREMFGMITKTYGDGVYYWSEGYKEHCNDDGVCSVINSGQKHRLVDFSSPLSFISDCINKSVDFCMPFDYDLPCIEYIGEKNPECGA